MGKIAFIFPGQGSQYVGMGKDLYDNLQCCKDVFDAADEKLGFKISELCFYDKEENLNITENTQPALLTCSIAFAKALDMYGLRADVVAGLSLGEYSALVYSGAMDFQEAVSLVKKRGRFMEEAVPPGVGGMVAILNIKEDTLREICKESLKEGFVQIANVNSPSQIVIGGEIKGLNEACRLALNAGVKRVIKLPVMFPFHTTMLKEASTKLEKELENIEIKKMSTPVITNVTGNYIEENIKEILKEQIISEVKWQRSIEKMIADGVDTFIEVGPGKTLSGFVKKIDKKVRIFNVEDIKSLKNVVENMKNN